MKRIYSAAVAALLLLLGGCADNRDNGDLADKWDNADKWDLVPQKVTLHARAALPASSTRICFGDSSDGRRPLFWEGSERIAVTEFADGTPSLNRNIAAEELAPADDGSSASFSVALDPLAASSYSYTAVMPADCAAVGDDGLVNFTLAAQQHPSASSPDPAAMPMVARSLLSTKQGGVSAFVFGAVAACGHMTLRNGVPEGERLVSVSFTAPEKCLAARFDYDAESGGLLNVEDETDTIEIFAPSDVDEVQDVWFSLLPVGEVREFSVRVTTDKSEYVRTVTIADDDEPLVFSAGVVSSFGVDMAPAAEDEPPFEPSQSTIVCTPDASGSTIVEGGAGGVLEVAYSQAAGTAGVLSTESSGQFAIEGVNDVRITGMSLRLKASDVPATVIVSVMSDAGMQMPQSIVLTDGGFANCELLLNASTVEDARSLTVTVRNVTAERLEIGALALFTL